MAKREQAAGVAFVNGFVGVAPFPPMDRQVKQGQGFVKLQIKETLVATTTVADCSFRDRAGNDVQLVAGATVFVRSDSLAHGWATATYEAPGLPPFLLVPSEFIVAVA